MLDSSTSGKNRATVRVGAVVSSYPHAREWCPEWWKSLQGEGGAGMEGVSLPPA